MDSPGISGLQKSERRVPSPRNGSVGRRRAGECLPFGFGLISYLMYGRSPLTDAWFSMVFKQLEGRSLIQQLALQASCISAWVAMPGHHWCHI